MFTELEAHRMTKNILEILGITSKEDVISNLLRYCIDVSPGFRAAFLQTICQIDSSDITNTRVLTRVSTDSTGIPDLIIAAEDTREKHLVIIENKLKADEGSDQTVRYSMPECVRDIKDRLKWLDVPVSESFIFLTLFPDQEPKSSVFHQTTYLELLNATKDFQSIEDPTAQLLFDAWKSLLMTFYSKSFVSPDDLLLAKLQETDPLEGNYLYFKSFFQNLSLERNLVTEFTFRSSALGRRYFGAVISKPSWHPEVMQKKEGGYHLNAQRNFNIHFEPQFHYLTGVMGLYIHYEINPYDTVREVLKYVPADQYKNYVSVRDRFIEALRLKGITDLKIGGRSNQIAKTHIDIDDKTASHARREISNFINNVAVHIDEIVDDHMGKCPD
jgi:hypothetical protein